MLVSELVEKSKKDAVIQYIKLLGQKIQKTSYKKAMVYSLIPIQEERNEF